MVEEYYRDSKPKGDVISTPMKRVKAPLCKGCEHGPKRHDDWGHNLSYTEWVGEACQVSWCECKKYVYDYKAHFRAKERH